LFTLNKTVSLVSDAATETKTSQSSTLSLSDFNKGITYLLTYFQSRDPVILKTVPGLQTLGLLEKSSIFLLYSFLYVVGL